MINVDMLDKKETNQKKIVLAHTNPAGVNHHTVNTLPTPNLILPINIS